MRIVKNIRNTFNVRHLVEKTINMNKKYLEDKISAINR